MKNVALKNRIYFKVLVAVMAACLAASSWVTFLGPAAQAQTSNMPPIVFRDFQESGIYTIDPNTTGAQQQRISGTDYAGSPVLAPDGKTIVFTANDHSTGLGQIRSVPVDGSVQPTTLASSNTVYTSELVFSPDGQTIYFRGPDQNATVQNQVWSIPASGGQMTQVVTHESNAFYYGNLAITPDEQYFVFDYYDISQNRFQIAVQPISGGQPVTVTDDQGPDGALDPAVSPDGKTIAYKGGYGAIYTVPFSTTGANAGTRMTNEANDHPAGSFSSQGDPAYSPDGQYIAYASLGGEYDSSTDSYKDFGSVKYIPAAGGQPTSAYFSYGPFYNGGTTPPQPADVNWGSKLVAAAPRVDSTTPIDGALNVAKNIKPTATFSADMKASTINPQNVKLEMYNDAKRKWVAVSSTVSYVSASKSLTVTPRTTLRSKTQYRVTISTAVTDTNDKPLESAKTWGFTTRK